MSTIPLTQDRLRDVLKYDQDTGKFRWKVSIQNRVKVDALAGSPDRHGYTLIRVDGKRYTASRLAWFLMLGRWPEYDIDHKDGDPQNNSWGNLRLATTTQNLQNKRVQSNNKCGLKGIWKHIIAGQDTGKWRARIKANGKHIHLGLFPCPAAAHMAYVVAADKYFGEFARF
jgi:hypothetical protein